MDDADQYWAQIEALRMRVRSVCRKVSHDELAVIDAEFVDVRERIWSFLKRKNHPNAPTHLAGCRLSEIAGPPAV